MFGKIKRINRVLLSLPNQLSRMAGGVDDQMILTAKALINSFDYTSDLPLSAFEFKVFSQWGDDGIIQYLVNRLDIYPKTFIEFGVENYTEANTRFLLINNNWSGLIIDGSKSNMDQVRNSALYWKYDLHVEDAFITRGNIDQLFARNGFTGDIGILSIDIDGNDYWVWEAISSVSPVVVIAEYNSIFGPDKPWTVPYKADFVRTNAHYSNLYYGSSLLSLCDLAETKGYHFAGCNNAGNNAYFVRKDKIGPLKPLKCREGYVLSKFRESRDSNGQLTFIKGDERLKLLRGMTVFNTRTGQNELIG